VDSLAKIRASIARLRKQEKEIAETVNRALAKRKSGTLKGYVFSVSASSYDMNLIDETRVSQFLTAAQLRKCYKQVPVTKLTFAKLGKD
jgi:hypothetical protein